MAQKTKTLKAAAKAAGASAPSSFKSGKKYTSAGIPVDSVEASFSRADVIFDGLEHAGISFEGRVFLNNGSADETTAQTPEFGYAGSFHIFGHGGCFGDDPSHCDVRKAPRPYDPRPAHGLTPARKVVIATDAVRQAIGAGKPVTVTVVPVVRADTPKSDYEDVLKFDTVSIVTYI
jgi:hypothetical protein